MVVLNMAILFNMSMLSTVAMLFIS